MRSIPRTDEAIGQVLPTMLRERGTSLRALAAAIGMSPSHLSRALRGEEGKHLSGESFEAIATELGVAPEFFREFRTKRAVDAVRSRIDLANDIYDRLTSEGGRS